MFEKEFGQLSRFSLNYDMTFLAILLTALYEPPTEEKMKRCMIHPMQKHRMYDNIYLSYAAEMTIVLTYLKCEDNWQDEHSHTSHMYQKVLKHRYESIKQKYPEKVTRIEEALIALGEEEKRELGIWICWLPIQDVLWQKFYATRKMCGHPL